MFPSLFLSHLMKFVIFWRKKEEILLNLISSVFVGRVLALGLGGTAAQAAEDGCLCVLTELVKEVQVRLYECTFKHLSL